MERADHIVGCPVADSVEGSIWRSHVRLAAVFVCLLGPALSGCGGGNCESLPVQQLRVQAVSYVLSSSAESLSPSDLGPVVGTINEGLPDESNRCESYTLHDGQGTPPTGSDVYSIEGIDQTKAVAARVGNQVMRFDSVQTVL